MRNTNTDFLNALTPAIVRFDPSPVGGSLVIFNQTPWAIYVNVASNLDFSRNPTKELFDRLTDLKAKYSTVSLPESTAPSDAAFQNARDFVLTLPLHRMIKPAIRVAADGEVNFQWSGPDFEIDLGFYGDGRFSFYGAKQGREPIVGDEVSVEDGIPRDLVDIASTS